MLSFMRLPLGLVDRLLGSSIEAVVSSFIVLSKFVFKFDSKFDSKFDFDQLDRCSAVDAPAADTGVLHTAEPDAVELDATDPLAVLWS